MNNPVIMHINYGESTFNSFGNKTIDDICKMAAGIGFNGIEFRAGYIPHEGKDSPFVAYVKEIAAAQKKYGLTDIMFGLGIKASGSSDKSERENSINEAIEKAKIVNDLCGTTICNTFGQNVFSKLPGADKLGYEFHGSAVVTPDEYKYTVESYKVLGEVAVSLGMKFAFETHMNYIHDLPAPAKKLVDDIDSPAIGINMDFGNTVYFPEHPTVAETIDIYGDKLFYTHLKNSSSVPGAPLARMRFATALSDGEINHREYIAKLKEVGFDGPIGIEAPRGGDRVYFAAQDFAYYKSIAESL